MEEGGQASGSACLVGKQKGAERASSCGRIQNHEDDEEVQ